MKTVYIAFANSNDHPLPSLTREYNGVYTTLLNQHNNAFMLYQDQYANIANMNTLLSEFNEELTIFHFSGHAGRDALLLTDQQANGNGIAQQLGKSAQLGALKLVVLNGCSTAGQVKALLEQGVPAVVATNAPVEDASATEFSLRFYKNLCVKRMSIRDAFNDALTAAQTATQMPLTVPGNLQHGRDLGFLTTVPKDQGLWELFYKLPSDVDTNPVPVAPSTAPPRPYTPNEQLTESLFNTLVATGNEDMMDLQKKAQTQGVSTSKIQKALLDVLPYPVSAHLQKLFSADQGDDGYDKAGPRRLGQIGLLYHIVCEFLGFIVISQLWELKIRKQVIDLPEQATQLLTNFFKLNRNQRAVFDYISFIRDLRQAFKDSSCEKIWYFMEELEQLEDKPGEISPFSEACDYLTHIRTITVEKKVPDPDILDMCIASEDMLCKFFEKLGFLHQYTLTSVQSILIEKYRHNTPEEAEYNHRVVKLMDAFGSQELNYYLLAKYIDNSGVIITKQQLPPFDIKRRIYKGDQLAFLNLSPFVIDRNAFESRSDRSNLMFFELYSEDNCCTFKSVMRPEKEADLLKIPLDDNAPAFTAEELEQYRAVRLQFNAFKKIS